MSGSYYFNPYAVPMALAGLGMAFVGTVVSSRRKFDLLGTAYFGVCASCALWLLGFTGAFLSVEEHQAFLWDKYLSLFGVMWIPSFCYLYAQSFGATLEGRKWRVGAAFGISAFFSAMLLFKTPWMLKGMHKYFFGYYSAYGPGMKYFLLCFAALMSAGNNRLLCIYKSSTSGIERKQALWVLLGFAVGTGGAYDYLPAYGYEAYPFGYICMFGFVSCFAYALEAYDLMDIRTAFVQTGAYIMAALLLVLPLAAVTQALRPILEGFSAFGWSLCILLLVVGVQAYWKWAEKRVVRFVLGSRQLLKEQFLALNKSLRYAGGLRETVEAAVDTLGPGLGLEHMSYWHLQADGTARRLAGKSAAMGERLQVPPALLHRLGQVEEVLEKRDLPQDLNSKAFVDMTQAVLVLPIRRAEQLQGFFLLGPKASHKTFKGYELQLLNDFREKLGEAMTSAVMTEQIQKMAGQVLQAEQRSRELEKVKAVFLEAVSHELKTPLFTLKGYAEALVGSQAAANGANAGMEQKIAQTIGRAAERIAEVVTNMVQAATMEKESTELRLGWFDLHASAERVLEPFKKKLGLVRFAVDAEPGLYAYGDKEKIEDVLFRLVSNAAKFSPPEGTVTVWARREGEDLEFGVSDQGPGISPEARKNLFQKFNRPYDGKDSVNLKNPGSGLGLYMAKMLVEIHRGRIEASEGGPGCTVSCALPQPPVPAEIQAQPALA